MLSLLAAAPLPAQTGAGSRRYERCLPEYLNAQAVRLYESRKDWQAGLAFVNVIQQQQRFLRDRFWSLVGGKPEATPLRLKTTGTFERKGYRVDKLTYESRPNYLVTANLYIPTTGKGPYPGVLFQMGHGSPGKAYPTYQRCCQGLARLGFAVLAFDPMGQGERAYYPELKLSPTDEHSQVGRQLLLIGETATQWQVWDAIRSLDVLAAHPMVDASRLASTGQSGGATLTMLLAAVDDRLNAAVVSMGNTENYLCAGYQAPGSTDDAEQDLLPRNGERMERWDLLLPFAPKPMLIIVSSRDAGGTYSPQYLENGREEFAELRRIYEVDVGRPGDLEWAETPLPHGLGYHPRMLTYRFLQKHLKVEAPPPAAEPPTEPEPAETLWAAGGNTIRAGSRKPHQIAMESQRSRSAAPADVRHLLMLEPLPPLTPSTDSGTAAAAFGSVSHFEVQSVEPVWLPVFRFQPSRAARPMAWLVLDEKGRRSQAAEDSLCTRLASDGYLVYAADVRGIGELTPELPRGSAGYATEHSDEETWAWAGLLLGRPLAGQRTTDILALVRAILARPEMKGRSLGLAASGRLTPSSAWAAALEPGVARLALYGGLASFRHLLDAETYAHPFSVFVPEVLKFDDLPALIASLRRPVALGRVLDGEGRALPEADVQRLYAGAPGIQLRQAARWDAEFLTG